MTNDIFKTEVFNSFELRDNSTQPFVEAMPYSEKNSLERNFLFSSEIQRCSKKKQKYFEGRNVIKKVKTHGLKLLLTAIVTCLRFKNYKKKKWKVPEKKKIFKIFKSDISKIRNRQILDMPMKEVFSIFSNINLQSQSFVILPEKRVIFDFLTSIRWRDFLMMIKRSNREFNSLISSKLQSTVEVTREDVKEYVDYISEGGNQKDRVNLDREYLNLYKDLEYRGQHDTNEEVRNFLRMMR